MKLVDDITLIKMHCDEYHHKFGYNKCHNKFASFLNDEPPHVVCDITTCPVFNSNIVQFCYAIQNHNEDRAIELFENSNSIPPHIMYEDVILTHMHIFHSSIEEIQNMVYLSYAVINNMRKLATCMILKYNKMNYIIKPPNGELGDGHPFQDATTEVLELLELNEYEKTLKNDEQVIVLKKMISISNKNAIVFVNDLYKYLRDSLCIKNIGFLHIMFKYIKRILSNAEIRAKSQNIEIAIQNIDFIYHLSYNIYILFCKLLREIVSTFIEYERDNGTKYDNNNDEINGLIEYNAKNAIYAFTLISYFPFLVNYNFYHNKYFVYNINAEHVRINKKPSKYNIVMHALIFIINRYKYINIYKRLNLYIKNLLYTKTKPVLLYLYQADVVKQNTYSYFDYYLRILNNQDINKPINNTTIVRTNILNMSYLHKTCNSQFPYIIDYYNIHHIILHIFRNNDINEIILSYLYLPCHKDLYKLTNTEHKYYYVANEIFDNFMFKNYKGRKMLTSSLRASYV